MKHLLACAAVCACALSGDTYADIVAPAAVPPGTQLEHLYYDIDRDGTVTRGDDSGGIAHLPLIYSDTLTAIYYFPGHVTHSPPHIVSDDLHMVGVGIGDFSFAYFAPGAGSWTAFVSFYGNTRGDDIAPPSAGGGAALLGGPFAIPGLPAGVIAIHADLAAVIPSGPDIWFEVDYSTSPFNADGNQAGPLITDNPGGAVGFSDSLFGWDGPPPGLYGFGVWGDFHHEIGVPEPAALTLLGVGALFVLRRRR